MPEIINQIELPTEIEKIFEELRDKVTRLGTVSSGGSVLANETLAVIGERTKDLAGFAMQQRTDTLSAIEAMRRVLQEIISTPVNNQDGIAQLTDGQAFIIGKYVDSIGSEPSGSRITNTTQERREIKLDLRERGIVTIILHLSGPTVLAWKLNRQKTEEEKKHLTAWLDRVYIQRSPSDAITLTPSESEDFLQTIRVEEPNQSDKYNIPPPRTFATIRLADGRMISMTLSGERKNNEYIAEWKKSEQQQPDSIPSK